MRPRRRTGWGAALTYARRYALFTLVGIAGEDDLDAPDLGTPTQKGPGIPPPPDRLNGGQHNGGHKGTFAERSVQRAGKAGSSSAAAVLGAEASAALCDGMVAELNALQGGEDAALWAYRCLPDKHRLTAGDAQRLEQAFLASLAGFAAHDDEGIATPEPTAQSLPPPIPVRGEAPLGLPIVADGAVRPADSAAQAPVGIARDRQDRFGIAGAAPGSGTATTSSMSASVLA